jgi:hypothetical protein
VRWPDVDLGTRALFSGCPRGSWPRSSGNAAVRLSRGPNGPSYYENHDLVFARVNGAPLRPDWVLDRFHELTEQAGLPRVR